MCQRPARDLRTMAGGGWGDLVANTGLSPGFALRLGAMRRSFSADFLGETNLMYIAPKILASLGAATVMSDALGTCPSCIS